MSIELWHDEDGDLIRPGNLDPDDDGDIKVTYYSEYEARELFGGGGSSCSDCDETMDDLRAEIEELRSKLSGAYDYIRCAQGDLNEAEAYCG